MKKLYFLAAFCCFLIFISCKKTKVDNETTSTTDYTLVSQELLQVFLEVDAASTHQKGLYNPYTAGPSYTNRKDSLSGDTIYNSQGDYTDTAHLPTLWIKYSNYTGVDGNVRNGTIKIVYSKRYDVGGMNATISFANYSVNDHSCQGTLQLTRYAASFVFSSSNVIMTNNKWSSSYSFGYGIRLSDNGTPGVPSDDYVLADGSASGTNRDGKKYDVDLTESLKKRADCSWISQGIVSLTPKDLHTRTVNFGSGICDDVASFIIDSQTFTIHMSK